MRNDGLPVASSEYWPQRSFSMSSAAARKVRTSGYRPWSVAGCAQERRFGQHGHGGSSSLRRGWKRGRSAGLGRVSGREVVQMFSLRMLVLVSSGWFCGLGLFDVMLPCPFPWKGGRTVKVSLGLFRTIRTIRRETRAGFLAPARRPGREGLPEGSAPCFARRSVPSEPIAIPPVITEDRAENKQRPDPSRN